MGVFRRFQKQSVICDYCGHLSHKRYFPIHSCFRIFLTIVFACDVCDRNMWYRKSLLIYIAFTRCNKIHVFNRCKAQVSLRACGISTRVKREVYRHWLLRNSSSSKGSSIKTSSENMGKFQIRLRCLPERAPQLH